MQIGADELGRLKELSGVKASVETASFIEACESNSEM
jgi:hypothetical protein